MYTVVRFGVEQEEDRTRLEAFGQELNAQGDVLFERFDRRGIPRFSISLCHEPLWKEHCESIFRFLDRYAELIRRGTEAGIYCEFDTAIDPDDQRGRFYVDVRLPPELMLKAAEYGVWIVVTAYSGANREPPSEKERPLTSLRYLFSRFLPDKNPQHAEQ